MSISKIEIQTRLRPWILKNLSQDVVDLFTDTEFLQIFNDVANDLNEEAQLNIERWYNDLSSVTSEDDNNTNYLMNGNILKVLHLQYTGADWKTQYYTYVDNRIVFNTAISGEAKADIRYLRQCADLDESYDYVDLPSNVTNDYVNLLKIRLLTDYGENNFEDYEKALKFYGLKASIKVKQPVVTSLNVTRRWMEQNNDDTVYNITNHYISLDNFIADVYGNYAYVGS